MLSSVFLEIGTEEFIKEHVILMAHQRMTVVFSFAKVPYGFWIIREVENPKVAIIKSECKQIPVTLPGKVDEVVETEPE